MPCKTVGVSQSRIILQEHLSSNIVSGTQNKHLCIKYDAVYVHIYANNMHDAATSRFAVVCRQLFKGVDANSYHQQLADAAELPPVLMLAKHWPKQNLPIRL